MSLPGTVGTFPGGNRASIYWSFNVFQTFLLCEVQKIVKACRSYQKGGEMRLKGAGKSVRRVWQDSTEGDRPSRKPCYTVQAIQSTESATSLSMLGVGPRGSSIFSAGAGGGWGHTEPVHLFWSRGTIQGPGGYPTMVKSLTQRFEGRGCGDGQDCSAEGSTEPFLKPRRAPQHPNLLFVLQGQIPQQVGKLYSVKQSPSEGTSLLSMMM